MAIILLHVKVRYMVFAVRRVSVHLFVTLLQSVTAAKQTELFFGTDTTIGTLLLCFYGVRIAGIGTFSRNVTRDFAFFRLFHHITDVAKHCSHKLLLPMICS